jgi:hypothetical protein
VAHGGKSILSVSPVTAGNQVVSCGRDGHIRLWDVSRLSGGSGAPPSSSSSSSSSSSHVNLNRLPGGRSGALAEMYSMVRTEGVRGLYRGILPEILKITPMVSITFCVYEWVLDLIEPDED